MHGKSSGHFLDIDGWGYEAYYPCVRKKNAAAQALANKRWKNATQAEKSATMRHAAKARWAQVREEKARAAEEEARAS
jgi:hypothetical protein